MEAMFSLFFRKGRQVKSRRRTRTPTRRTRAPRTLRTPRTPMVFSPGDNLLNISPVQNNAGPSTANAITGPEPSTSNNKRKYSRRKVSKVAASLQSLDVVNLDQEDTNPMMGGIKSKIGDFFKQSTNYVISSSDDEDEAGNYKSPKKPCGSSSKCRNPLVLISDEDDSQDTNEVIVNDKEISNNASTANMDNKQSGVRNTIDLSAIDSLLNDFNYAPVETNTVGVSIDELLEETERLTNISAKKFEDWGVQPEVKPKDLKPKDSNNSCPICLDELTGKSTFATVCGHVYCEECIKATIKSTKKCPICRKGLTLKKIHAIYLHS